MTSTDTARTEAIARMENTRAVHLARGPLFAEYVRDCDIAIARLRAGLGLTDYQRGIPA